MLLTLHNPQEGVEPEIWVNLDLAVSMQASGDRTRIQFTAPRRPVTSIGSSSQPTFDTAPRYIEVVEPPAEILKKTKQP